MDTYTSKIDGMVHVVSHLDGADVVTTSERAILEVRDATGRITALEITPVQAKALRTLLYPVSV